MNERKAILLIGLVIIFILGLVALTIITGLKNADLNLRLEYYKTQFSLVCELFNLDQQEIESLFNVPREKLNCSKLSDI